MKSRLWRTKISLSSACKDSPKHSSRGQKNFEHTVSKRKSKISQRKNKDLAQRTALASCYVPMESCVTDHYFPSTRSMYIVYERSVCSSVQFAYFTSIQYTDSGIRNSRMSRTARKSTKHLENPRIRPRVCRSVISSSKSSSNLWPAFPTRNAVLGCVVELRL